MVGDLDHRRVGVLRQREIDRQSPYAPVAGNQSAGDLDRVQGDLLDSPEIGIAQAGGVVDQRFDGEVVFERFAVVVVGEGVDARGVRHLPCGFGQFLNGAERLAGEHGAVAGRDGDEHRLGFGEGRLEGFECGELRIAFIEQDAVVVRDADAGNAGRYRQHEERSETDDGPTPAEHKVAVAVYRGLRFSHCEGYASGGVASGWLHVVRQPSEIFWTWTYW